MNGKPCTSKDGLHHPVIRSIPSSTNVVCKVCGLMLDFRPFEEMGFLMSDWKVQQYTAPKAQDAQS